MRCENCGYERERPGDLCLSCEHRQTEAVVLALRSARATLTMVAGETVLGETTITTVPESEQRVSEIQQRAYVERIASKIRRKRPDGVYAAGEISHIRRLRGMLVTPMFHISGDDPVAAYFERQDASPLDTVDASPAEKLGGAHTTIIGGRSGVSALHQIAEHPNVKSIIPGPIDASGRGTRDSFRAKATRATSRGNLRVLLRAGSSVQEIRVITTGSLIEHGERIADQLNDAGIAS